MLYDWEFLRKLDQQNYRETNIRITSYDIRGLPKDVIVGKVTGGNISIDGKSSNRRQCSLTLTTEKVDINDYFWCFNTQINIEMGVANDINLKYDPIIWFPMGRFIITSFNISLSTTSTIINLTGKDKMSLLNGELGGIFESAVTFDTDEYENLDGSVTHTKLPIKTIVREMVHTYGNEPYGNIIISGVPDYGLQLQKYLGKDPLYIVTKKTGDNLDAQATLDGSTVITKTEQPEKTLEQLSSYKFIYDNELILKNFEQTADSNLIGKPHRYFSGDACGYKIQDLIYPDELVANAGESVTSVLDKICQTFGGFEYFYDLNGKFIFQRKSNFVNLNFDPQTSSIAPADNDNEGESHAIVKYSFENNNLIMSFQNNPNHQDIKNDFVIWGTRKGITGAEYPVHLRVAIDQKPTSYETIGLEVEEVTDFSKIKKGTKLYLSDDNGKTFYNTPYIYNSAEELENLKIIEEMYRLRHSAWNSLNGSTYESAVNNYSTGVSVWDREAQHYLDAYPRLFKKEESESEGEACTRLENKYKRNYYSTSNVDWRELIYRMAVDYMGFNQTEEFLDKIGDNNSWIKHQGGRTGYEIYYTDMFSFWRTIYRMEPEYINIFSKLRTGETYYSLLPGNNLNEMSGDEFSVVWDYSGPYKEIDSGKTYYCKGKNNTSEFLEVKPAEIISTNYEVIQRVAQLLKSDKPEDQLYIELNIKDASHPNGKVMHYTIDEFYDDVYTSEDSSLKNAVNELYDDGPEKITSEVAKWRFKHLWRGALRNKKLCVNRGGSWLPIGVFRWPLYSEKDDAHEINKITQSNKPEQTICFATGEGDNYMKLLTQMSQNFNGHKFCHWDQDFFPYYKVFALDEEKDEFDDPMAQQLKGWNKSILTNPANLKFWFNLIDDESLDLAKYSVCNIGDRRKVVTNNNVTGIYFFNNENVLFDLDLDEFPKEEQAIIDTESAGHYAHIHIPETLSSQFMIMAQGRSAMSVLEDLIDTHTICSDQISVSALPVYYLEPNSIVSINDVKTNISGVYLIDKITYQLSNAPTMSMSGQKYVDTYSDRKEIFMQ